MRIGKARRRAALEDQLFRILRGDPEVAALWAEDPSLVRPGEAAQLEDACLLAEAVSKCGWRCSHGVLEGPGGARIGVTPERLGFWTLVDYVPEGMVEVPREVLAAAQALQQGLPARPAKRHPRSETAEAKFVELGRRFAEADRAWSKAHAKAKGRNGARMWRYVEFLRRRLTAASVALGDAALTLDKGR